MRVHGGWFRYRLARARIRANRAALQGEQIGSDTLLATSEFIITQLRFFAMQVGFIGLDIMGTPMAAHLLKAGHKLYLRNLGRISQDLIGARAVVCTSGAEVARNADIIIIMVPDTPDVGKVLFGPDGVASGLTKGKTVVHMSSISPIATNEHAAKINQLGC